MVEVAVENGGKDEGKDGEKDEGKEIFFCRFKNYS